ncbi:HAMP domain-containing protein [Amycolatopsis pigmentata]|uniref:histidine kinase n=1 Tax=Amycolatopsis pigmentata TaxID=450801 RepID=A0ABW5G678_9PSEU
MTETMETVEKGWHDPRLKQLLAGLTAVRDGDFGTRLPQAGDELTDEIARVFNGMVDQLARFTSEVTRVAREVGTDGNLGGQAEVTGVSGGWKDLTDSVNAMAGNLTSQVRDIAQVATAVAGGDLSQKIRVDARGEIQELKNTINTMVDQLSAFAEEVTRVAREVGTDGILGGQARVPGIGGTWRALTDSVNSMAGNLTGQVRSIAQVATAVAQGDLSQKIRVDARGEIRDLKETINTMVDRLSAFADEVTRVAREVGTEGILGGQARVPNVAGTWKDLTDNVNSMANNLTSQVRNIAQVTTAVARGDLTRKIDVDARGEILELKTTINTMVDTLGSFAAEVTRVAREVGSEGRLGGQAEVEGVSGTWKRLTENVNELAGNLTRQVRAIAEVAGAVATGDLTRSITVEAQGEVAQLKDNINTMVRSLRETTEANQEKDWLKTNLALISGVAQGHRDLATAAELILDELVPIIGAQFGAFFLTDPDQPGRLRRIAAYGAPDTGPVTVEFGQSLVGQAARGQRPIVVDRTPPGYVKISSSLGESPSASLIVLPVVFDGRTLGVLEIAAFTPFNDVHRTFLEQLLDTLGVNLNTIIAGARTDALLAESQRLAAELRSQQEELEERAEQLALASKYKSEFLANMSHELRTPLNSLLILAKLLAQNTNRNLTAKQVEYAEVIHSAGTDLLRMINDILDLSKVEAGKVDVHPAPFPLQGLLDYVQATFHPLTVERGLEFSVAADPDVPTELVTDEQRLRQVLRNLLSNAVKFTESGGVELRVRRAGSRIAFAVTDTGVGIAEENVETVFGAFQQGDGTTSRRYGGTGLGLSISREIAGRLGGEIRVDSELGRGSTFTLYLPVTAPIEEPIVLPTIETDQAEPKPPRNVVLHGRKILLVEDDPRNVFALTGVLEAEGAIVVRASNGGHAIDTLRRDDGFDLVLMDVMMPEMDGYATTAAIREMPRFSGLPIIAVTAKAMRGDREKCIEAGASDYLIKPVEPADLLTCVERWLQ